MANEQHLEMLKRGVEEWNAWRREHADVRPDLGGADLTRALLRHAHLRHADLSGADLTRADLSGALLTGAHLSGADLIRADLNRAQFASARFAFTVLGDVDLSAAIGLDKAKHIVPSTIGLDTVYRSHGKIPEVFLRGCGVPENFITYMHSLTGAAFEFYSCFISYSTRDQEFADRLYADLQARGVRCWFAPEDMKTGDRLRVRLDEAIRLHEKLLLVLSETSVASAWVEQEVETALARERASGSTVLFPIRIDNTVMGVESGWPALIKNTRQIGDFTGWADHHSYRKAFERLMRDLQAGAREATA